MKYGFIVEGTHDRTLLETSFNNVQAVTCRGLRLQNRERTKIDKMLQQVDEVYILTDSDKDGDDFAKQLSQAYPSLQRIRLDERKCTVKRGKRTKVGVEHASVEYLAYIFKLRGLAVERSEVKEEGVT